MYDPVPLPPELAAPAPDSDRWLSAVVDEAVSLADEFGLTADEALAAAGADLTARWTITDDGAAEWAMRHVCAAEQELERLQAQAAEWEARIEQWKAHQSMRPKATLAFMTAHLERYAKEVREADPKRKTLVLPSGAVSTTAVAPRLTVTDEAAAREWAKVYAPEALVDREPKLLVSVLRNAARPTQLLVEAQLTLSCGCTPVAADQEGLKLPALGTEMECESHGPALLGRVEVRATRWVVVAAEDAPTPRGVDVDPGGIRAKVVPAP